jgi:hypothetical protein
VNTPQLYELLTEGDALLMEPRSQYDAAIVAVGWRGPSDGPVAVYDRDRVLAILAQDMDEDEAEEWFEYNMVGSWVGPATPIFVRLLEPATSTRPAPA